MTWQVIEGDCLAEMRKMPANSVDAVVTDPPYGLSREPNMAEVLTHWLAGDRYEHGAAGFMGRSWDSFVPGPEYWREVFRVLKPGGHLLAFGGTRTFDLLSIAIRLAGFENRDTISSEGVLRWYYGQGFPKSMAIDKQLDKQAGAEREVIGPRRTPDGKSYNDRRPRNKDTNGWDRPWKNDDRWYEHNLATAPATDAARQWAGYGTALKPAWEPVLMFRKPLACSTVAGNVLEYSTGALNIEACRIAGEVPSVPQPNGGSGEIYGFKNGTGRNGEMSQPSQLGRWPPNVVLSEDAARALDEQAGAHPGPWGGPSKGLVSGNGGYGGYATGPCDNPRFRDGVNVSRFFPVFPANEPGFRYVAKASRREREAGLEGMAQLECLDLTGGDRNRENERAGTNRNGPLRAANHHPTVKPIALMRWLARLVCCPGGTILDPFAGSGSTGCAAVLEGFNFVGIEMDADYCAIARRRIAHWAGEDLPLLVAVQSWPPGISAAAESGSR